MNSYDKRIARIMAKIEALKEKEFSITCGAWPPVWKPPFSEKRVTDFEAAKGIRLPEDYRRFITTVAGAGSQPFYGLEAPFRQEGNAPQRPFPFTLEHILYFLHMTEEEIDALEGDDEDDEDSFSIDQGLLTLCTEGCGMDSVLVVNSQDPDTYGTVWFFDVANEFGAAPMRDKNTGNPFHFLDWLEYWADRTAGLGEDDFFSFSETVQLPEPPDNPDIIGRKQGWIK